MFFSSVYIFWSLPIWVTAKNDVNIYDKHILEYY